MVCFIAVSSSNQAPTQKKYDFLPVLSEYSLYEIEGTDVLENHMTEFPNKLKKNYFNFLLK